MHAEHDAEEALVDATIELVRALCAEAPKLIVQQLVVTYHTAFDRWMRGHGFDLNHSSFEQGCEEAR